MSAKEIKLLSPYRLGNLDLKNRIVISPMCQYSAQNGLANDWHLAHLGSRATGGAGFIIQEATAVSPEARITYADLGLWNDEQIAPLKRIVDFVHQQGAKIGVQLAHAGRKASCQRPWDGGHKISPDHANGWQTVAPSAVGFREEEAAPIALTAEGIQQVKDDFKAAVQRTLQAGYDAIEIHAAHGYLLHQFYSPLSNHRTDEYGGSFENRIRLTLEVVQAVQEVWGKERALIVRISATDWVENGWNVQDSVRLAIELKKLGVHLIDTSSGGNVLTNIPAKPNYQVGFAAEIRKSAGIATSAVGLISTPQQAEEILQNESADLILIARESLRNPNFPLYAAYVLSGEDSSVSHWPKQYERAYPTHGEWK
ncbi:2,4-dienoyl-CoA reductase [Flexibacter flexilis DSM 6793]|uniref:2,4-dienoyl-CoA reductase n=1 Tax=Flexibacter flexilis DSM 6793 TaxID=927664 RepID=A0A1I1NHR3_9BACT|nr:NADH:flavin oxidoreductase/NADH oxidase [Flexibacter flexilis]SFC97161.1 2,4-dienoyl-CoA reductase [Flexibacter flexilis DSM 6793]